MPTREDYPCEACHQPASTHVWPEVVPCPKCGATEHVEAWEAWGHPNGDLLCWECCGYNRGEVAEDYFTFRKEGDAVIVVRWEKVEATEPVTAGGPA